MNRGMITVQSNEELKQALKERMRVIAAAGVLAEKIRRRKRVGNYTELGGLLLMAVAFILLPAFLRTSMYVFLSGTVLYVSYTSFFSTVETILFCRNSIGFWEYERCYRVRFNPDKSIIFTYHPKRKYMDFSFLSVEENRAKIGVFMGMLCIYVGQFYFMVEKEMEKFQIPKDTYRTVSKFSKQLSMQQALNMLFIGGKNDTTQVCNFLALPKEEIVRFCSKDSITEPARLRHARNLVYIDLLHGREWLTEKWETGIVKAPDVNGRGDSRTNKQ